MKMWKDKEFEGFRVVPVKFTLENSAQHWLFYRQHSVREKSINKPSDRTLFIINVPSYCTEEAFHHVFSAFGPVTTVFMHQKPTGKSEPVEDSQFFKTSSPIKGFKVAYVVFETTAGLQKALRMNKSGRPLILSSEEKPITCGLQKWCEDYNQRIPDTEALQKDIDSFMESFDLKSEEKAKQEKEAMQADEEGWITVTKRGRKPGFARKESIQKKIMGKEREKRSKKELLNFYRFQIRESKMNHLVNLRKKFEEDKKKLAFLKQSRKFKPF